MSERIVTIACDLDGTLAHHDTWRGIEHIGAPIAGTLDRVKAALARGWEVEVFTARVAEESEWNQPRGRVAEARRHIEQWCLLHVGRVLPVTAVKSGRFVEFWDDKAVSIQKNEATHACAFGRSLWEQLEASDEPPDGGW